MASSSIVLKSLSILLGLFFIFIGTMKITPHISKELHKDLVNPTLQRKLEKLKKKLTSLLFCIYFIILATFFLEPVSHVDDSDRKEYVKYAKVFPFTSALDFKIPSKWYRRVVGGLEIACGLAMAVIPSHKIKNTANITLLLLMFLAVYSHYMVSDPFERSGPALVFTFMLGGRLVVWFQTSRREEELALAASHSNGLKQE